jgi:acetyl-CoA synthetase
LAKTGELQLALEWFDPLAGGNDKTALWIVKQDGSELKQSFDDMARRSNQVANWLRAQGSRAATASC